MNAVGWFVVGGCAGAVLATLLIGLLVSGRRADDLAQVYELERLRARTRRALGGDADPERAS